MKSRYMPILHLEVIKRGANPKKSQWEAFLFKINKVLQKSCIRQLRSRGQPSFLSISIATSLFRIQSITTNDDIRTARVQLGTLYPVSVQSDRSSTAETSNTPEQ